MPETLQTDPATTDSFSLHDEIERLHLLQQIAQLTAGSRDQSHTLPLVLDQLQNAFAIDGCGIYLIQQDDSPLTLTTSNGLDAHLIRELQKVPPRRGLISKIIDSSVPHNWVDLRGEEDLYCGAVLDAGWRSLLGLPLIAHGRTLGALFFFQRIPRQFARSEIALLEEISLHVAAHIETSELLEKLEWQHRLTQASQRELERSRKQLREHLHRLEIANSTLEQLSRMKDRFLALASHELRTPLTCILSAGQLLEEHLLSSPPDTKALLATILQGGDRLNNLVENLLEMARIESRDIYLARENIDLSCMLQTLLNAKDEEAQHKGIDIHCGSVPDLLSPCGDRHHLERALVHLLDNAIKFTPVGGRIEIDADYVCNGELLEMRNRLEPFCPNFFNTDNLPDMIDIRVIDSGTGIEEQERLHIFEKFHSGGDISLHGRERRAAPAQISSVGLGLPLAKGLVEAQGGLLWSENRTEASGSIFHAMLPLYRRRS